MDAAPVGLQLLLTACCVDWRQAVTQYAIAEPSNKLLALTDLDSDTWVAEVKRIRGKKQPLQSPQSTNPSIVAPAATLDFRLWTLPSPARAPAAETLTLERTLKDLVNQAYALTPAETALMWQTAPPRMPIPPP